MDIKDTNSNNVSNSLEKLQVLQANVLNNKALSKVTDTDSKNESVDSASSDAFSSLKLQVSLAKEAGRAEYLAQLKESIASGEYQVNSNDLASALLADGAGEFLAV